MSHMFDWGDGLVRFELRPGPGGIFILLMIMKCPPEKCILPSKSRKSFVLV